MEHAETTGTVEEEDGRTTARMTRVSALVLILAALAVWIGALVLDETRPAPPSGYNPLGLLLLPFLAVAGPVAATGVSWGLVLPAVGLAEELERRSRGRARWWLALMAAAPAALLAPLLGAWWWWPVGWAALTLAALAARAARRGTFVTVLLWGTAAVLGVGMAGGIAVHTGLIRSYAPPRLSKNALVGTWTDGDGGRLTFTADGRVRAEGVQVEFLDEDEGSRTGECAGEGGWIYRGAADPLRQEVVLDVEGCSWPAWEVGGTDAVPTLRQFVGDVDDWRLYELRKAPAATR